MLAALLCSLTLGRGPALPTLTPEDVARNRALEKYEGKRVLFAGWLHAVRPDERPKDSVYEVQAVFYDQAAASRDLAPSRVVSVAVCFARDVPRLRDRFKEAQQTGERLRLVVEGKVVRHPAGWRLERAILKDGENGRRKP